MEEIKLVREEMYKRVQELIRQKNTSGGRAALAKLRRGIGKKPGEMPELWGVFLNKMSPELFSRTGEPSRAEWAIYISLTMFALHQQGSPLRMRGKEVLVLEVVADQGITPAYAGKRSRQA